MWLSARIVSLFFFRGFSFLFLFFFFCFSQISFCCCCCCYFRSLSEFLSAVALNRNRRGWGRRKALNLIGLFFFFQFTEFYRVFFSVDTVRSSSGVPLNEIRRRIFFFFFFLPSFTGFKKKIIISVANSVWSRPFFFRARLNAKKKNGGRPRCCRVVRLRKKIGKKNRRKINQ